MTVALFREKVLAGGLLPGHVAYSCPACPHTVIADPAAAQATPQALADLHARRCGFDRAELVAADAPATIAEFAFALEVAATGGGSPIDGGGHARAAHAREQAQGRWQVGFPRRDDTGTSDDGYRERDWRDVDQPAQVVTEKARSWVLRDPSRPVVDVADVAMVTGHHTKKNDGTLPRPADQPAPTIAFGHAAAGWAWVVNTGRDWKPGGTRDNAQQVDVDQPAPTVDASGGGAGRWHWENRWSNGPADDAEWPLDRPATTVAGDPRIAQPGHKVNRDDAPGAAPGRMAGSIRVEAWEAAVLQDFPADYPWRGTKTKVFEQIGNAVPPGHAAAVLAPTIHHHRKETNSP